MTAFYQETGRIYLGAVTATLLVTWIMTAGMLIWCDIQLEGNLFSSPFLYFVRLNLRMGYV